MENTMETTILFGVECSGSGTIWLIGLVSYKHTYEIPQRGRPKRVPVKPVVRKCVVDYRTCPYRILNGNPLDFFSQALV